MDSEKHHTGITRRRFLKDGVLVPSLADGARQVVSGDCTRCGDCIDVCPTGTLGINVWYK